MSDYFCPKCGHELTELPTYQRNTNTLFCENCTVVVPDSEAIEGREVNLSVHVTVRLRFKLPVTVEREDYMSFVDLAENELHGRDIIGLLQEAAGDRLTPWTPLRDAMETGAIEADFEVVYANEQV